MRSGTGINLWYACKNDVRVVIMYDWGRVYTIR